MATQKAQSPAVPAASAASAVEETQAPAAPSKPAYVADLIKLDPAYVDEDALASSIPMDSVDMDDLIASIRAHGQLDPIAVRKSDTPGRHIVVDGVHRLRAIRIINEDSGMPMRILARDVTYEDADISDRVYTSNFTRRKVTPAGRVLAYFRAYPDTGETTRELQQKLRCKNKYISEARAFLAASEAEADDDPRYAEVELMIMAGDTPLEQWRAAVAGLAMASEGKRAEKEAENAAAGNGTIDRKAAAITRDIRAVFDGWQSMKFENRKAVCEALNERFAPDKCPEDIKTVIVSIAREMGMEFTGAKKSKN